jgi:Icc-related predicted phosphoesterase
MVRLAAIGDLHVRNAVPEVLIQEIGTLHERADVLVITGDITHTGRLIEAEIAAELFKLAKLPIIGVLGNHDRWAMRLRAITKVLGQAGVQFLNGTTLTLDLGQTVGFAGVSGCGGGFWEDEGPMTLSRRAWQAIGVKARREALRLDRALQTLDGDIRIVVTHFAPTTSTLGREPLVKYNTLGTGELERVIDRYDIDLVLHGHAHSGNAIGRTAGGTLVRNVAIDVGGGFVFHDFSSKPRRVIPRWQRIEAIA